MGNSQFKDLKRRAGLGGKHGGAWSSWSLLFLYPWLKLVSAWGTFIWSLQNITGRLAVVRRTPRERCANILCSRKLRTLDFILSSAGVIPFRRGAGCFHKPHPHCILCCFLLLQGPWPFKAYPPWLWVVFSPESAIQVCFPFPSSKTYRLPQYVCQSQTTCIKIIINHLTCSRFSFRLRMCFQLMGYWFCIISLAHTLTITCSAKVAVTMQHGCHSNERRPIAATYSLLYSDNRCAHFILIEIWNRSL